MDMVWNPVEFVGVDKGKYFVWAVVEEVILKMSRVKKKLVNDVMDIDIIFR